MIRHNISTFLNTTNPRWPPYYFVKRYVGFLVLRKVQILKNDISTFLNTKNPT